MHLSNVTMPKATFAVRLTRTLLVVLSPLGLTACFVGATEAETEPLGTETAALVGACVLGDGYTVPNHGSTTVYPVSCGSNCYDYPNGGFATALFCVNGVLGESDPALSGGSVAPIVNASYYNGYGHCNTLPTATYSQTADRLDCIRR